MTCAAQTPKIDDVRPVKKSDIKNPGVKLARMLRHGCGYGYGYVSLKQRHAAAEREIEGIRDAPPWAVLVRLV